MIQCQIAHSLCGIKMIKRSPSPWWQRRSHWEWSLQSASQKSHHWSLSPLGAHQTEYKNIGAKIFAAKLGIYSFLDLITDLVLVVLEVLSPLLHLLGELSLHLGGLLWVVDLQVEVDAGGDQDDNEDYAGETSKLNVQLGGFPINMSLGGNPGETSKFNIKLGDLSITMSLEGNAGETSNQNIHAGDLPGFANGSLC